MTAAAGVCWRRFCFAHALVRWTALSDNPKEGHIMSEQITHFFASRRGIVLVGALIGIGMALLFM